MQWCCYVLFWDIYWREVRGTEKDIQANAGPHLKCYCTPAEVTDLAAVLLSASVLLTSDTQGNIVTEQEKHGKGPCRFVSVYNKGQV